MLIYLWLFVFLCILIKHILFRVINCIAIVSSIAQREEEELRQLANGKKQNDDDDDDDKLTI